MSKEKIRAFVVNEIVGLTDLTAEQVTDEMALIGADSNLESRSFVELTLACEQFLEDEYGKEFSWYSDGALSGARSPMRNVGSLVEFIAAKAEIANV